VIEKHDARRKKPREKKDKVESIEDRVWVGDYFLELQNKGNES